MTSLADQFEALLPCPFCGAQAHAYNVPNSAEWFVECSGCSAEITGLSQGEDSAIAAWNNRTAISSALTSEKRLAYRESARDWTEDYPHENGQYLNHCHFCGALFCGHKRRVQCKVCAHPAATIASAPPVQEGFVLVPREPTPKMHRAAWQACDNDMPPGKDWAAFNAKLYAAMISAAPEPTGVSPTGDQS